jgi:squalene-hopene/tetraprenyl-beta-curcumene cyclase
MSIRLAVLLRNSRKTECGAKQLLIRVAVRATPFALLTLAIAPAFCADWNAQLAERYMDSRQKEWIAWPMAMHSGVACVSCHTGLTYLLTRPLLRQALGEKTGPTLYENVLVASMRATVIRTDANDLFAGLKGVIIDQVYGAQVVLSSLVLAMDDAPRGKLSPEGEKAFDRMWSLQLKSGPDKGAWLWSDFDLDPWETKDSAFYGAALAALATGLAPADYQARPEIRENVAALKAYLREGQKTQPLHNRLFLLWASSKLRDLLPAADKQAILDELWRKQEADGGWSIQSLGQWKQRDAAPSSASTASNSYATALVAFTTEQAGVQPPQASLSRALAWLRSHQNPQGYWAAESMNHKHEAGTVPEKFMSDAATGYATAALLAAGNEGIQRTASSSKPRN